MIRKITLLLLLFAGLYTVAQAQTEDTVRIYMPYGTDTTCPGEQLNFTAVTTSPTIAVTYEWFENNVFDGVIIDTLHSTALNDGDSVFCRIHYTNSLGMPETAQSNTIYIHRSNAIPPRVLISLTSGSNPDCPGHPLTFTAYPINGGSAPAYQWLVDGVPVVSADSVTFTRYFNDGDSVTCVMTSNSPCAAPTNVDTSDIIPVIHDSLTATLTILTTGNPICAGTLDSFIATVTDAGLGSSLAWYVNTTPIPTAVGNLFITNTLNDHDHVYAVLTAPDICVINDTTVSNVIDMTVIPNQVPTASITLTHGANPGCLDSAITFTATTSNVGALPNFTWYVNGAVVASGVSTYTSTYVTGDLLTFQVNPTDGGCYTVDTFSVPDVLMIRDTTPVAPLVSLIGNLLVANTGGTYIWYFNGNIIPGANAQTYHPTSLGYYYAIRDTGNCQSLASNTIYISLLGVNEVSASETRIYPNPTNGVLNMDWGAPVDRNMDVYNMVGQGLLHQEIRNTAHYEADLSYLPEGNYMVVLKDKDGIGTTHKITITR